MFPFSEFGYPEGGYRKFLGNLGNITTNPNGAICQNTCIFIETAVTAENVSVCIVC